MGSGGESLTYGRLDTRSNQLAHFLRARGVRRGGPLVIVMENRIEWPVVVAAGMRAGLYVTPVNWHLTVAELTALLAEALGGDAPGAVVTSAACAEAVAEVLDRLGCGDRVAALCVDDPRPGSPPSRTRSPAGRRPRSPTSGSARACCTAGAPRDGRRRSGSG